jgi:hypothetical protein
MTCARRHFAISGQVLLSSMISGSVRRASKVAVAIASIGGFVGGCRGRTVIVSSDYLNADPSCFIHPTDKIKEATDP